MHIAADTTEAMIGGMDAIMTGHLPEGMSAATAMSAAHTLIGVTLIVAVMTGDTLGNMNAAMTEHTMGMDCQQPLSDCSMVTSSMAVWLGWS